MLKLPYDLFDRGPSRSGKTILAKRLQERTGAYLIPLDYVEAAVTEYFPEQDKLKLRPFSTLRDKTDRDNDRLVEEFPVQEIIDAYEKQGESVWKGIMAIINYELQRKDSIIIEGYQITPSFVVSVLNKYENSKIRSIFLVKEDVDSILKGWEHLPENDWLCNSSDSTLRKYAELTAQYGLFVSGKANELGLTSLNTEKNFEHNIESALSILLDTNS